MGHLRSIYGDWSGGWIVQEGKGYGFIILASVHSEIPFFSSPLTGEDEGGGEKYFLIQLIIVSPSPVSPPARGGEIKFPDGY